jgi:Icc-related predicted phosphoesterase
MSPATRILVVADELAAQLHRPEVRELEPDLIVSCGDLPFDYLEYLVSVVNVPLVFVPGNHDPAIPSRRKRNIDAHAFSWDAHHGDSARPLGCRNIDGRIVDVAGLRIAGLGGCIRYNQGPNQYTQQQMTRRALMLEARARTRLLTRKGIDVLVTHAPPEGCGDGPDAAHRGIRALHRLTNVLQPAYLLHGHIHPYGIEQPDRRIGATTVVNTVPFKLMEVES